MSSQYLTARPSPSPNTIACHPPDTSLPAVTYYCTHYDDVQTMFDPAGFMESLLIDVHVPL